jgi:hypothetical protein
VPCGASGWPRSTDRKDKLVTIEPDQRAGAVSERACRSARVTGPNRVALPTIAELDADGRALLARAAERLGPSAPCLASHGSGGAL